MYSVYICTSSITTVSLLCPQGPPFTPPGTTPPHWEGISRASQCEDFAERTGVQVGYSAKKVWSQHFVRHQPHDYVNHLIPFLFIGACCVLFFLCLTATRALLTLLPSVSLTISLLSYFSVFAFGPLLLVKSPSPCGPVLFGGSFRYWLHLLKWPCLKPVVNVTERSSRLFLLTSSF